MLALGQDHPAQRDQVLVAHRVADDRERLEGDLVLRNQIVRAVDIIPKVIATDRRSPGAHSDGGDRFGLGGQFPPCVVGSVDHLASSRFSKTVFEIQF